MLKRVIIVLPLIMIILDIFSIQFTYCLGEGAVKFKDTNEVIEYPLVSFREKYLLNNNIVQRLALDNIDNNKKGISSMMCMVNEKAGTEHIYTDTEILFYDDKIKLHKQNIIYPIRFDSNIYENIILNNIGNGCQKLKSFNIWRFTAEYYRDAPPYVVYTGEDSNIMKALIPTIIVGGVAILLIVISAVHKKLNK